LTPKLSPDILVPLIDKITTLKPSNSVDASVPAAALRTIITSFPRPVNNVPQSKSTQEGYAAISKMLIPRLIGYDTNSSNRKNPSSLSSIAAARKLDSDAIDVLVEVIRYFGPMLQDAEKQALQRAILDVFDDERINGIIKKKALVAMSALAFHLSDRSFSALVSATAERFGNFHLTPSLRRILITMVGSLAKSAPQKLGPYVKTLAPHVLSALSKEEYDQSIENLAEAADCDSQFQEVREAALVALEVLLSSCSHDMRIYTEECIAAGTFYVSYNPTHAPSDNDEEMEENPDQDNDDMQLNDLEEGSDDFEEEEGLMSDDDDVSWKVRRCAAKVLTTIISTRSHGDLLENGTLYEKIAPALINCFEEREENVRLEILVALSLLIKKTSDGRSFPSTNIDREAELAATYVSSSRKRRRAGSDADSFDSQETLSSPASTNSPANMSPSAVSGPRADLARWSPSIVLGMAKLLQENSIPTKQAAIAVLRNMIHAGDGLSEQLEKLIDPIVHAFTAPNAYTGMSSVFTGAGGSTTATKLRIEALQLIGIICDTHSPKVLSPHIGHIIANVNASMRDQQYRVSSEAVRVTESIIKSLTPPRSIDSEQNLGHLGELYHAIFLQILAVEVDLEVRQRAVHALGVLLARTSGAKLSGSLSISQRLSALSIIFDRLKNETTRLSAIQAIGWISASATEGGGLGRAWVNDVAMELGRQLRKADRILRATSLGALNNMALNPVVLAYFDGATIRQLATVLLSLLSPNDLNLLSLALAILAKFVSQSPIAIVDKDLDAAICALLLAPLGGAVIESFLGLVKAIGEQGVGRPIMERLLQEVGVTGDPAIVGKSIGTLLVSGGASVRVKLDDFARELQSSKDEQRKCLSLSVLGEAGLRLGSSSPLQPDLFTAHFRSKSNQVALAAAVALGCAGAGNIDLYLPVILSTSDVTGSSQYLSLHSIKELLQYVGKPRTDISPYTQQIWEKLLAASQGEDNKAVGAECIGRLTVIEPKTFLPLLQVRFLSTEGCDRAD
jgi:cullin-associated NEDD8-dissociated protein 1